jgi:formate hydrogenlyase subunit 3/multisubunit Na+/H+ antiporter MnhD subunit
MVIASATAFGEAGGIFTGGEPLVGQGRLPASDFSLIVRQGLEPFYRWANPDVYYLGLWRTLVRLGQGLGQVSAWLEHRAISATLVLAGLLAAATGLLVPVGGPSGAEIPQVIGWRLPAALGLALLCLLLAASSLPNRGSYLWMMAVSGLLAVLGLFFSSPVTRILILEGATLLALILVWLATSERKAAWAYLLAVFLSAVAILCGTLFLNTAPGSLLLALFLVGVALKLALVPLYIWLPMVAEAVPAPLVGLIVALIDVAAFGEFLALRSAAPWIFSPDAPWLALALFSAVGGAGLMLAQRDLKRLLAFSSIEDMGYLLFAATLGGELGLNGAMLGAIVHALGKAMLFASLSKAETDGLLKPGVRSLAARYPLSGAGFTLGALAILGFPPTLGYVARWRIYTVAANASPWLLGALLLASALAVLAYARALVITWWGAGDQTQEKRTEEVEAVREPLPLAIALLCAGLILLLTGLWPRLLGV